MKLFILLILVVFIGCSSGEIVEVTDNADAPEGIQEDEVLIEGMEDITEDLEELETLVS